MREILFKGKRKDNGEWIYGFLYGNKKAMYILDSSKYRPDERYGEIIPVTVGQYTGLTDKNSKKIFEGDIVEFLYNDFIIRGKVFYSESESAFVVYYELSEQRLFIHSKTLCDCNNAKVIGNIYDNPELLEVTE